jgi:hypothetical protein
VTEALIDTDILSFYFKGDPNVIAKFRDYLKEFDQINISIITFYEIVGGLKHKKAGVELFLNGKGKKIVGFMNWFLSNLPRVTPDKLMMKIKKNLASVKE